MRAGAGLSTAIDPQRAINEASRNAIAAGALERGDFALVLVTSAHGDGISEIASHAEAALGAGSVLGASVEGLLAAGEEIEQNPGVAVLARFRRRGYKQRHRRL